MSSSAGSFLVRSAVLILLAAAGCGGGNTTRDAGGDATDAFIEVGGDGGVEAGDAPVAPDADVDSRDAADAPDAAGDATDAGPGDAPLDAMDGPVVTDGPSEEGPPPPPPMLTVDALLHSIVVAPNLS